MNRSHTNDIELQKLFKAIYIYIYIYIYMLLFLPFSIELYFIYTVADPACV